jgi:hypothetical protein
MDGAMSFVTTRIDAGPRDDLRHYINRRSRLHRGAQALTVWTVDMSGGGARVGLDAMSEAAFSGAGWCLTVPGLGSWPVTRRWQRGACFGLDLDLAAAERAALAARLAALPPAPSG